MTRSWLAGLAAAALLAGCRPAGPPPATVPVTLPGAEPMVRVGIVVGAPTVEVGAAGPYEIRIAGGEVVVRAAANERWIFAATGDRRVEGTGPDNRRVGPYEAPIEIRTVEPDRPVLIGGQPYRGGALIRAAAEGSVTAINLVDLEAYLLGVVPREIGARPQAEIEAVKAQAIAARTYAVSHLGSRQSLGFDYYATVADQVYGGVADEHPVTSQAVRDTRGEIVTHQGLPILAYFHSTCGGRTASIEDVWPRAPLPYLKSVSDEIPGSPGRFYCEPSSRFRWTQAWDGEQLRRVLTGTLASRLGNRPVQRVEQAEITGTNPSGRARALRLVVDGRTVQIEGDSIRYILRPEPDGSRLLNSSMVELTVDRSGGEVRSLEARGGGWGHGIGMCQFGAMGRARAGQNYRQILTTYYRDTQITRIY